MKWGIIGTGGHSKVVLEAIKSFGHYVQVTCFSKALPNHPFFLPYPIVLDEEKMIHLHENTIDSWHVAIGDISIREKKLEQLEQNKLIISSIIHKNSIVSPSATIDEGTFVNAGAVVNASTRIGRGCIINTSASIDHDCMIGDFVNIGPGSRLAGHVSVGTKTEIGTGVSVAPHVKIGKGCIIGIGSVVVKNIPDFSLAYGVPAQVIKLLEDKQCKKTI
ncbi:acetyltransferase [Bacillus sp. AFS017274]|uniref:acetyltransferase n=1 Tax=Bacillaceae TaxID=186817 RepID=UPI000BF6E7AF|nr:acetyltransferase [Bacillus sp. AFS017274]PEZ84223.1 transferase [Bacillus sp. AFS017274]